MMLQVPDRRRAGLSGAGARASGRQKALLWAFAALVLLPVLVWLILFVTRGRFLKAPFEDIASRMSERQVAVHGDFQLYFAPFDLKFHAEGLSVSNPGWASKPALFGAQLIDLRAAPLSLIAGPVRLRTLVLEGADIDLEWDKSGQRNTWTFSGKGQPLELPRIGTGRVEATTLHYGDPPMGLFLDLRVETIRATGNRIADAVRFSGDGRFRGKPLGLEGALQSPNATLAGGENRMRLTVTSGRDRVDVSGKLPGLTEIEGVPLNVEARGRNASELFALIGIVIPKTRAYALKTVMVKRGGVFDFSRLDGHFGASDIAGGFKLNTDGPRNRVEADLRTRTLDIVDVSPFIGYDPDTVAAKGVEAAARETGTPQDRLLPDASLRADGVRAFDADVRWTIDRVRAEKLALTDISMTAKLDDGLLRLDPLDLTMERGRIGSQIGIDWRPVPAAIDYDVRLHETPLGRLLKGYGVEESGTTGTVRGRIQLKGRGDTLHDSLATSDGRMAFVIPKGTFWARNVQLSELDIGTFIQKMFEGKLKEPVEINCGLVAFTVRNGVAGSDPILIDTAKNVITGRGGFSFGDEAIDMRFRADAKKFSLVSAQTPVMIAGRFAEPKLQVITPELFARGGAAVAGGALAGPIGALFAFIDIGDAKSAACGPVLAAKPAVAQRTTKGKPRGDVGTGKIETPGR